jgi:hypothetical protein
MEGITRGEKWETLDSVFSTTHEAFSTTHKACQRNGTFSSPFCVVSSLKDRTHQHGCRSIINITFAVPKGKVAHLNYIK